MAPLPRQPVPMLARLEEELRFAPREVILRVVDRTEALAPDITDGTIYPSEWVVHRVTGYRPEKPDSDLVPWRDLLAGLSPFSERLTDQITLTLAEVAGALSPKDLQDRWQISPQTLARLRRQGLVARRVIDDSGHTRLVFRRPVVEAFEAAHRDALGKAGQFSQLSDRERRWALRAAPRYRRWAGLSTQAAAKRIAVRLERATETIRTLLAREGLGAKRSGRDLSQSAIWRAWRWGASAADLAHALRRSPGVVRRDIGLARKSNLVAALPHLSTPGHRPDAGVLASPAATMGLGLAAPDTLEQLLALARGAKPPVAIEERTRLAAFHALRARAARDVLRLSDLHPQPRILDRAETDLRWAARLGAALVFSQLRTIVSTLEVRLEQPLDALPGKLASAIIQESLRAAAASLESIDPAKGGRVAGPVGLGVDRVGARLAKHVVAAPRGRARTLGTTPMPDWTLSLFPWQRRIEADPRLRAALLSPHVPAAPRMLLAARFGFANDGPPRTLSELAHDLTQSERAVGLQVSAALAAALAPLRGPAFPGAPRARTLPA